MTLTRNYLTTIRDISRKCSKPDEAYSVMKQSSKETIKLQKQYGKCDLFQSLSKDNTPIQSIGIACKNICKNLSKKKEITMRNTLMTWIKDKALRELDKIKRSVNNIKSKTSKMFAKERPGLNDEFIKALKEERSRFRKIQKQKHDNKIKFLRNRWQHEKIEEHDNTKYIEGVQVEDWVLPEEFQSEPRTYGGTELSNEERELLSLPTKFSIYEKVKVESCECEIEKALAKYRWDQMRSQTSEGEEAEEDENEEEGGDEEERIWPVEGKKVDLRHMRATDMPYNKRVYLPEQLKREKEVKLQNLKEDLVAETRKYVTNEKYVNNLTKSENSGLKSIKNKNEYVIFQTDKSGRFAVDSKENYKEECAKHVTNDRVIDEKEHLRAQTLINAHSTIWANITKAGEAFKSSDRVKNNLLVENSDLAPIYALRKDHKICEDINKGPPTRPVCGAASAYNNKLSNFVSTIIKPIWTHNENVCTNTEEMMAAIKETNEQNETEDIIVGSADVKALYPSLDVESCAKIVSEMFVESDVKVEGVDSEEIGLYLALNLNEEELKDKNISQFCPKRKNRHGAPPTITGCALNKDREKRMKPWTSRQEIPNEKETRKLLGEALKVVILFIMKNHIYQFDGKIYKQEKGGPIGLELTGDLAQIFMIWFDRELLKGLQNENINVRLYKRYVDDIDMAIKKQNVEETDEEIMNKVKSIGNKIHPTIELEVDYPSKHEDKKVPILDLKVWVEHGKIMHEFYRKEMATKSMVHARSAMPMSKKRTIITQELIRVMTRCSPELAWKKIIPHLNEAMKRVQYSGYNKKFRCEVLRSAIKAYKTIRHNDKIGLIPMYRTRQWKKEQREKEKRKKKTQWFKGNGAKSVVFVPATPNSKLKKLYEEAITKSKIPIKVVEKSGPTLKNKVQKSDPLREGNKCMNAEECFVCKSGGKACRKEGITYEIECDECKDVYIGESARNGFTRGKEHINAYRNKHKSSVMFRHSTEKHGDFRGDTQFKMRITGQYRNDPTLRQVTEGTKIKNAETNIINTKTEWNSGGIVSVNIVRM